MTHIQLKIYKGAGFDFEHFFSKSDYSWIHLVAFGKWYHLSWKRGEKQ